MGQRERLISWVMQKELVCGTGMFSKIVKRCTFRLVIYARKYTKRHKMDQNKPCNNIGTPRKENWPIIFNFLIGLIHKELNFRCISLFRKIQILTFTMIWVCQGLTRQFSNLSCGYLTSINLMNVNHHDIESTKVNLTGIEARTYW